MSRLNVLYVTWGYVRYTLRGGKYNTHYVEGRYVTYYVEGWPVTHYMVHYKKVGTLHITSGVGQLNM